MSKTLKAALITEWHPIDVINFYSLFRGFEEFELYPQSLDIFCQDEGNKAYDVAVYFNLSTPTPEAGDPRRTYFEQAIGTTDQGIVLLHHGILNYPEWPVWDPISGVPDRHFKYFQNQAVQYQIESKPSSVITRGVHDFEMVDETYQMAEPTADNVILITAEHPMSMKAIAWTRKYKNSKVFCYQSGHDAVAYKNPNFQALLHQGMLWAAGKLS